MTDHSKLLRWKIYSDSFMNAEYIHPLYQKYIAEFIKYTVPQGVDRIIIFGSVARQEQGLNSDLDIYVESNKVVSAPAISPNFWVDIIQSSYAGDELKINIMKEGIVVYEKSGVISQSLQKL